MAWGMRLACEYIPNRPRRRRSESERWLISSADVLSTVQSSMSAGQDASQTLSRLMDWAEAREVSQSHRPIRVENPVLISRLR